MCLQLCLSGFRCSFEQECRNREVAELEEFINGGKVSDINNYCHIEWMNLSFWFRSSTAINLISRRSKWKWVQKQLFDIYSSWGYLESNQYEPWIGSEKMWSLSLSFVFILVPHFLPYSQPLKKIQLYTLFWVWKQLHFHNFCVFRNETWSFQSFEHGNGGVSNWILGDIAFSFSKMRYLTRI